MKSKWYKLKDSAMNLRKKGLSIGKIEHRLGIPRSTLSGWFKNIKLSSTQKDKLLQNWKNGLVKARKKAVLWHNAEKQKRLKEAYKQALSTLCHINNDNKYILELALAILYLGEGAKTTDDTSLGNSNPLILKFFLLCLKKIYHVDTCKIRCELHLRADQDPENMKKFWSKKLGLPIQNFKQINIDKRTVGSKTYPHYKGVCALRCGNVAIKRKLMYISQLFCKRVVEN